MREKTYISKPIVEKPLLDTISKPALILKAKSLLSQGRKSVVIRNTLYCWEKDKKSITALTPDFDMIRRVFEIIKNREKEK